LQALVIAEDRVEIDYSAPIHDVFPAVVHKALRTDREDQSGFDPRSNYEPYVGVFLHQLARSLGLPFGQGEVDNVVDIILHWKALKSKDGYTIAWRSHNLREAVMVDLGV
jgi:hypothetical protein